MAFFPELFLYVYRNSFQSKCKYASNVVRLSFEVGRVPTNLFDNLNNTTAGKPRKACNNSSEICIVYMSLNYKLKDFGKSIEEHVKQKTAT